MFDPIRFTSVDFIYRFDWYLNKWLIYEVFLCPRVDIPSVKKWFSPFDCVSWRKMVSIWWKLLIKMIIVIMMAVVVMMLMANDVNNDVIVMLTIMVTATVIIIKSKMIKMVMMMIIVKIMIRQWMLELLYIYTRKAFRFKHFAAFFL